MHDARRYRVNAANCLLAARECEPRYRALYLSMALSWLSLARQDEVMANVLASCDTEVLKLNDCAVDALERATRRTLEPSHF
jgi:hypothetical protein